MPELSALSSYPAVFVTLALSGLGIPVPEDIILLLCGMAVGNGTFTWTGMLVVAFAAVLVRDVAAWCVGRFLIDRLLRSRLGRRMPRRKVDEARAFVARRGPAAAFTGRFMAGARVPIFVAAGASGLGLAPFLAWDALGMVITLPLTLFAGAAFGQPAVEAASDLLRGSGLLWLAAGCVLAAALWMRRGASRHQA